MSVLVFVCLYMRLCLCVHIERSSIERGWAQVLQGLDLCMGIDLEGVEDTSPSPMTPPPPQEPTPDRRGRC